MAYQQYGKIEDVDINTVLVGAQGSSAAAGTLNSMWGIGNGDRGYGQTPWITNVLDGARILNSEWNDIISYTNTMATHQNTSLTANPAHQVGKVISYDTGITKTNIDTIYQKRLSAKLQGVSISGSRTSNSTWINTCTFNFTFNFPSANECRYFFNCGGQLKFDFSHPTGTGINALFNQLGTACGTIWLSSPKTGTINIGASTFDGVTKIGGSGTPDVTAKGLGYYGLSTTFQTIFKQKGTSVMPGYADSYIEIKARTNGTLGSNGDNGTAVYVQIVWDEVPNGATVSSGTTVTGYAIPPARAGVVSGAVLPTLSWGLPVITSTVVAI